MNVSLWSSYSKLNGFLTYGAWKIGKLENVFGKVLADKIDRFNLPLES